MGSGDEEEGRGSGMGRVEQLVRELAMKDGEDLNREEEVNEMITGGQSPVMTISII
jgi:hypothetical protein